MFYRRRIEKLELRVSRQRERIIKLETQWKFNLLDEIVLDSSNDKSFYGITNKDTLTITDRIMDFDNDGFINSIHYRVVVNKEETTNWFNKAELETLFKLK